MQNTFVFLKLLLWKFIYVWMLFFAGYTFLGGLAGTLFYGLFKPAFDNMMQAVRTDAVNK